MQESFFQMYIISSSFAEESRVSYLPVVIEEVQTSVANGKFDAVMFTGALESCFISLGR